MSIYPDSKHYVLSAGKLKWWTCWRVLGSPVQILIMLYNKERYWLLVAVLEFGLGFIVVIFIHFEVDF